MSVAAFAKNFHKTAQYGIGCTTGMFRIVCNCVCIAVDGKVHNARALDGKRYFHRDV